MQSSYVVAYNRKKFFAKILFIAGMGAIFIAFAVLYFATFAVSVQEVKINRTFYFLVLPAEEQTVSVISQDAYVGGGAGYAFSYKGAQYVGLASYKTEEAAKNVQGTLEKKGKITEILPLTVDTFYFNSKQEREAKAVVEGCVITLLQCIDLLYDTANGVDTARYTQGEARGILNEMQSVFSGLRENSAPQTEETLNYALRKCREITSGIIYAKDIRYLQLFLSEEIYNMQGVFCK